MELLLVGAVGSFDLAVELRRSRFHMRMSDTQVFDMQMELRLKLRTTKRKLPGVFLIALSSIA